MFNFNFNKLYVFLIGFVFYSSSALHAQWQTSAIEWVSKFNCDTPHDIPIYFDSQIPELETFCLLSEAGKEGFRPHYLGVKDGFHVEYLHDFEFDQSQYQVIYVPIRYPAFKDRKTFKVAAYFQNKPKSDLIVYLPGVFQGLFDAYTLRTVEIFVQRGYSIVVIPNGLSADYQEHRPYSCGGHYLEEAKVIADVVNS